MEFGGPYFPLIIALMVLSFIVQGYLSRTYGRWGQVRNARNLTGAQVARMMLDDNGLQNVPVNMVPGNLTDHYDPQRKTVNLSEANFNTPSISAMAVAAHEVGHAIQDKVRMPALVLRGKMALPLGLGMNFAPWLFMAGLLLQMTSLIWVGVALFAFAMLFHLITLPVEFNASNRALVYIKERGLGGTVEGQNGSQKVLTAAALTYVLGFAMALAQLLNMIGIARNND